MAESREEVTKLWRDYDAGREYQNSLGLTTQIPLNVDFYEGRQWPQRTEATKNIPRPVVNIIKFIVRNKKASIVGAPVSVVFTSNQHPELAQKLTEFNQAIENEMEMDDLRNRKVDEGIKKGTGITHYYWDAEARGEIGEYEGGVRAEIIDPLNVFFSNPQEHDEQKQKWIIIAARVEVDAAKNMLSEKYKKNAELIVADDADVKYTDEREQDGTKLCTVLTRYYRQDGEVYYERAVKQTMLHDGIPVTPPTKREIEAEVEKEFAGTTKDENMDAGEDKLQDEAEIEPETVGRRFTLYPISVYNYELREKSIYGIGEVEELIPNQKAINFIYAMQLLSIQNLAWGKWIVKNGALGKQRINTTPGQVLTDFTPYGVTGISRTQEPPISNTPMSYADNLMNMTRVVVGSTEVMTGEAQSSGQSGQAIANLQAQALKPIQELRERYLRSCKREAQIIKQYYELFYDGRLYEHKGKDENGKLLYTNETFSGEEMRGIRFDVSVEAGAGTPYSESLEVSLLTEYLAAGRIDFETYLELLPAQIATFKTTLLKKVKESSTMQLQQMQEQLAALQEQIQQYDAYLQQYKEKLQLAGKAVDRVDKLINENRRLQATLAELQAEYTAKINQANAVIGVKQIETDEVRQDAETMALMLAETDTVGQ
ncbi:MAG: hypothetical protein IJX30_00590 [Clostridia bacterium]|nr:hypothetical protein [Clostridia bacterium]